MSETTQKTDKIYINGLWLKKREFADGGSILKVSVLVDKFVADLQKYKKADGFVNFDIKARKEVKESGESHYAILDTFTPNQNNSTPKPAPEAKKVKEEKSDF